MMPPEGRNAPVMERKQILHRATRYTRSGQPGAGSARVTPVLGGVAGD
jgi:hypothetical protein